jgi:hypothetical protein
MKIKTKKITLIKTPVVNSTLKSEMPAAVKVKRLNVAGGRNAALPPYAGGGGMSWSCA